jgi:hypothetical protein
MFSHLLLCERLFRRWRFRGGGSWLLCPEQQIQGSESVYPRYKKQRYRTLIGWGAPCTSASKWLVPWWVDSSATRLTLCSPEVGACSRSDTLERDCVCGFSLSILLATSVFFPQDLFPPPYWYAASVSCFEIDFRGETWHCDTWT